MSVCNGALILAGTGLLGGLTATTFHGAIEQLCAGFPAVKVVSDQRLVDNGKFITTAGLSAGIDGALHVVSRLSGPIAAQMVALNLEYDWRPDGGYVRAALADYPLWNAFGMNLDLGLPSGYHARLERNAGDRQRWNAAWRVETQASDVALAAAIDQTLRRKLPDVPASPDGGATRSWRYNGPEGRSWRLDLTISAVAAGVKQARIDVMLA
jgi:hypothetical protein